MEIVGGALPGITDTPISECTRSGKLICSTDSDIQKMRNFLLRSGVRSPPTQPEAIVEQILNLLGLEREADIYESKAYQKFIGAKEAQHLLFKNFVGRGPSHSTALLSDSNIDGALARWALISKEEFGKKFYHVPFQMIDFATTGTELANLDLIDLRKKGFDCFGVIINTDVSTGRGIHWFCIYGDLKPKDNGPITLEYFNSSGYPPRPEITYWLEKTALDLRRAGLNCEIIYATGGKQVQYSKTECGVWSLVYIRSRLDDHPYHWIMTMNADDEDMIEYRKRIFRPQ
jgi:hypothetical protein